MLTRSSIVNWMRKHVKESISNMLSNIYYFKQNEQVYRQLKSFVCSRKICLTVSGLTYNSENGMRCYLKNSYYYGWLDKVIFF